MVKTRALSGAFFCDFENLLKFVILAFYEVIMKLRWLFVLSLLACNDPITEDPNIVFDPMDFLSKAVKSCDTNTLNYMAIDREDLAPWDMVYNMPEDTFQKIDFFNNDGMIATAEFRAGLICEFYINNTPPPDTTLRLHVYNLLLGLGYTEMGVSESDSTLNYEFIRAGRPLMYSFSSGANPDGTLNEHFILTTH